jgi:hypothetical protein
VTNGAFGYSDGGTGFLRHRNVQNNYTLINLIADGLFILNYDYFIRELNALCSVMCNINSALTVITLLN